LAAAKSRILLQSQQIGNLGMATVYVNPFKGMPLAYWNTLPEPDEAARQEAAFLRGLL
jgi:hypothetical protein